MLTEKRIEVYLPEKEHRALKQRALKEERSISEILRGVIREYLARQPEDRIREGYKVLGALIGFVREKPGVTDVSVHHDDYIGEALEDEWRRWHREPPSELKGPPRP